MTLVAPDRLTGWLCRCVVVTAVTVAVAGVLPAPALALPKWHITMTHANPYGVQASECPGGKPDPKVPCGINPLTEADGEEGAGGNGETFARESGFNTYKITVENAGDEGTNEEEEVTVVDLLPKGLVLAGEPQAMVSGQGWAGPGGNGNCKVLAGGVGVECARKDPLGPGSAYPEITLHVHVTAAAENPSVNVAEVKGARAPAETTKEEGKTTVTNAVPFDIAAWTVSVEDSLGNPFNQAGGHPLSVTTEILSNYTTASGGELVSAGGRVKEELAEVPPGFVGNPMVAPRCQLRSLFAKQCPADTAVGYIVVAAPGGGRVVAGKPVVYSESSKPYLELWSSLIYNLEPAPGFPAQFGLNLQGFPYVLDAKLRSDGDYGVTVDDSAIAEPLLGSRLTFCENGAKVDTLETTLKYSCQPAPAETKPFNSNPTQCPSTPSEKEATRWTLLANSWEEPAHYASNKAYPNADVEGVTGCNLLQFNPGIEFKPRGSYEGGTTQADEPNGVSFTLRVPQETSSNATPQLKALVMKLPAELTPSASAADGLEGCSNAQFGLGTEFGPGSRHSEPAKPASCPQASQIGTFEVFTPLLSGAPKIAGKLEAGQSLTCTPGNWSDSANFRFTWLRDGTEIPKASSEIPGAQSAQYTLTSDDEGQAIQCQVRAANAGGRSAAISQDAAVSARFEGELEAGETIIKGIASLKGATVGAELFAPGLVRGTRVTRIIDASELEMSAPATAPAHPATAIAAIPTPPFPQQSIATPGGTPSVGNTLTCYSGVWKGNPSFKFTWLRDGAEIPGASTEVPGAESSQYTLTAEDEGKAIQCQVKADGEGGVTVIDSGAVVVSPASASPPPLPGGALQGQVYQAQPECSPCTEEHKDAAQGRMLRLFLQAQDPSAGVIIKLHGAAYANEETGQLETRFEEQPQQPFELLTLKLKGGPRAVLANPQSCGAAVTFADLTPWSTPDTPDAIRKPEFSVDSDGAGGSCPPAWPFNPSFNAGTTGPTAVTAGAFTQFSLTFGREDREQYLSGVEVHLPRGLVGKIAAVKQCGEAEVHAAERNEGECPAESQVGTATAGAGPGVHPFFQKGKVYLTGPYKGAPFGLAVVTPAVAGPFNLGNIVVRSAITVDPSTAAVTATSDPLPQLKDGVLLRLRKVKVDVNNPSFMVNPTNCAPQQVSARLTSTHGADAHVSSPFDVGGCAGLAFSPELSAEAGGHGSKANGTSLTVKVKAVPGQANIAKTFLQLPIALPSRLDTIQKACPAATFEANPASCGEGSNIGTAIAHTPLLKHALVGPAYLVSHGNAAFPDVEFVLQGEGITLILDGKIDIKKGITYSRFETVPDAPVSTFEAILPAGPHSALTIFVPGADQYNACNTTLVMPTEITGQNGAVARQTTRIAFAGCVASKPAVKIAKVKLRGNTLLVTVSASATGRVKISGRGLKTTTKSVSAGTHEIRVALTKAGRAMRRRHRKTTVHVSLTVGKQAVAKATSVRL